MDGPRASRTKSDRKTQISYDITYTSILMNGTSELYKTERLSDTENKHDLHSCDSGIQQSDSVLQKNVFFSYSIPL